MVAQWWVNEVDGGPALNQPLVIGSSSLEPTSVSTNTIHWPDAGWMLAHRHWHWPNIHPVIDERFLCFFLGECFREWPQSAQCWTNNGSVICLIYARQTKALSQHCFNVGPSSSASDQHQINIGLATGFDTDDILPRDSGIICIWSHQTQYVDLMLS